MPSRSPFARLAPALVALLTCAGLGVASHARATEVRIFRADGRDTFLQGELEDLSIDTLGGLELAREIRRVAEVEEPFVFTAAGHPEGWVLGTGNSGRVLLVRDDGTSEVLWDAEETEIFAVTAGPDGTVYAASSPWGKVVRIADGVAETVFDPEEAYVWDLAVDDRGRLLVATGFPGRLYRLTTGGEATLVHESVDSHLRKLQVLPDGSVLVGTAGQGLLLSVAPNGDVRTLFDAVQPEIAAFAVGPDGRAWAAALASEASLVDLSQSGASSSEDGEEAEVSVVVSSGETVGSRGGGSSGPRSVLLEIAPDGTVEDVLRFPDQTVHSLLAEGDVLWIGTGQDGHLYRYRDGDLALERDLDERQIPALVRGRRGTAVVTTNAAGVYALGDGPEAEGVFTSGILDAGESARFGTLGWEGRLPRGTSARLAVRTGMSAQPDATWTEWRQVGEGREASLREVSEGRYVQWRVTLVGGDASPRLTAAELSYRQLNLAPSIESFEVLAPGEVLVPNNFNPQSQVFEPWSPNREGIFVSLAGASDDDGRLKTLWKKGYRTLRWEAEDANGDTLEYTLELRAVDGDEPPPDEGWLAVATELEETWFSFDTTVVPDGSYRFRLTASDGSGPEADESLTDRTTSEIVVVDNTPPRVTESRREGDAVVLRIEDAASPLREAAYSVDAGEWRPAKAADGILDGRVETLRIPLPERAELLILRVMDASWNVVTFDLATVAAP